MKKSIILLTSFIFASSSAFLFSENMKASAAEYKQNGFTLTYTVSGSEASITGCASQSSDASLLEIPEKISGYNVTSISAEAFAEVSGLSDITLPDSVESIADKAFWNCKSLSTVHIGSSTAEIGDYAFSACPRMRSFTVSENNDTYKSVNGMLYSINGETLISYAGQSDAEIPEGTKTIGKAAFFGNSLLSSVSLPSGLSYIGDYAFSGCFSLQRISVPITVKTLGKGCFMNCTSMTNAVLGAGISNIPEECFSVCTSLEIVNIPSSVKSISSLAFFGCSKISGIHIPETVSSVGAYAIGMRYDIRSKKNVLVKGFYISGCTGSAIEKFAKSSGVDFLDFDNIPYGDVDGSGNIDSNDASIVLSEYAKRATSKPSEFTYYQNLTADYDKDNIIDSTDASLILAEYARRATEGL